MNLTATSTKAPTSLGSDRPILLVVDDDPEYRAELGRLLQHDGFDVLEASTGDEALELIADHLVAVVVTDLVMPGLNGFELMRTLRGRGSQARPRVIAITDKYGIDIPLKHMAVSLG